MANENSLKPTNYFVCCIEALKRLAEIDSVNIETITSVTKRNRHLYEGDFIVRAPPVRNDCQLIDCAFKIAFSNDQHVSLSCFSKQTDTTYFVRLKRDGVFSIVIKDVMRLQRQYGYILQNDARQSALINIEHLLSGVDANQDISIDQLRSLLLSQHIQELLSANGYTPSYVAYKPSEMKGANVMESFSLLLNHRDVNRNADRIQHQLTDSLKKSDYRCDYSRNKDNSTNISNCCDSLNLRKYLEDHGLSGKQYGYDPNIRVMEYSEDSRAFKGVCILEESYQQFEEAPSLCVHVLSYKRLFHQQTIDLGWKILADNKEALNQVYVQYGAVELRKSSHSTQLPSAADYLALRREQVREAFIMKYGEQAKSPEWESTINTLSTAAIKFELLTTSYRSPVKLDISDSDGALSIEKGGVFVMYNCARLATLLESFEARVEDNIYPPLMDIEKIDFSCLREEEEWELLFNYVFMFPNLVETCVAPLKEAHPLSSIHTHKVCQFLLEMSRDLSSYYNRVHILGEPKPHLHELMCARLYLMKTVQHVMHNGLSLLSVEPVTQL